MLVEIQSTSKSVYRVKGSYKNDKTSGEHCTVLSRGARNVGLHEGDLGMCSVDLPHVQLLILFYTGVDGIRLEALGRALLHHVCHLHRLHTLGRGHLTDDRVDLVCHILCSGEKTRQINSLKTVKLIFHTGFNKL